MALTRIIQAGLDESVSTSEITSQGAVFSNYDAITENSTIVTSADKNTILFGPLEIKNNAVVTVSGDGAVEII